MANRPSLLVPKVFTRLIPHLAEGKKRLNFRYYTIQRSDNQRNRKDSDSPGPLESKL